MNRGPCLVTGRDNSSLELSGSSRRINLLNGYSHVLIPVVILFAGTPTGTDLEAAKHVGRGTSSSSSACRLFLAQVVAHLTEEKYRAWISRWQINVVTKQSS